MNVLIMRRLQDRARSEADFAKSGQLELEAEQATLKIREFEISLLLELARNADLRAQAFKPLVAASYRCPCCAVYCNAEVDLVEVQVGAGRRRFTCINCANDFDFDMQSFGAKT